MMGSFNFTYQRALSNWLIISGNGRNVGKTWLACELIKHFSCYDEIIGIKISPHFHNSIDIKDNRGFYLNEEKNPETGKDSSRMLGAGAKKVFYIESDDDSLKNNLNDIILKCGNTPVVVESAAIINHIMPGLFIFIKGNENIKNEKVAEKADIIIENTNGKINFNMNNIRLNNKGWFIH